MKFIKFFVVVSLLLLNGCGSDDEKNEKSSVDETKEERASVDEVKEENSSQNSKKMTIKGKSTLAQAVVCLDSNKNAFCDEDEPQSTSDVIGKYLFEAEVKEGDIILSQGGFNLILLEENTQNLAVKASYIAKNEETNLNTLSSIIADSIEKDGSYENAKARIATKNGLDIALIEKNPIDLVEANENDKIFLTIRAIEERVLHPERVETKKQKLSLNKVESTNFIISEKEADDALWGHNVFSVSVDGGFVVALYGYIARYFKDTDTAFVFSSIGDKILQSGALTECYLFGSHCPPPSSPVSVDKNDSLSEELVTEDELMGVWRVHSNLRKQNYCVEISSFVFTIYRDGDGYKNFIDGRPLNEILDKENILIKERHNVIDFDEEERRLDIGSIGSYYVTKSDLVEDKLYFTNPQSYENITLTLRKHNSLDECISKRDNERQKNSEEFNATVQKIKNDFSKNAITRKKLNGIWYHKVIDEYNTYPAECLKINANDTIEYYSDEKSSFSDIKLDNKSPLGNIVEDKMFLYIANSLKENNTPTLFENIVSFDAYGIYTSKSNIDTIYLTSSVADVARSTKLLYIKLILQPNLESCIAKVNEQ